MKKILPAIFCLFAVLSPVAFGQATEDVMLNLRQYSSLFINDRGRLDTKYSRVTSDADFERIAPLGGDPEGIDTPLEIALLSNSEGVVNVRPIEASRMLGTAKQADLKLGAAVFQEIQILRFLGDTAAVGRHEGMLKFIADRGNATRAEVENFYRNGIRGLITEVVDESVVNAQASRSITLPDNIIPEIKQLLTNFCLSPNKTDYDAIKNYVANRKASDEREIQRIRQMNIPGAGGDYRRQSMELDVELVTTRANIILLQSCVNLGFR